MRALKIVTTIFLLLLVISPIALQAQWGTCLHFTQSEHDKVTVYDTPSLWPGILNAGTVELWFKPDTIFKGDTHGPDYTYIFCKNISGNWVGDMGLHWWRDEGVMKCFIQSGDATNYPTQECQSDNDAFDARWYHVAYVWDTEGKMRLFIDGKQQQDIEPKSDDESCYGVANGTQLINIGTGAQDMWYERFETFPGCIDEVRLSGLARYTDDFEVPEEPLEADAYTIALWHFDEGSGTVANDASGYGFTGTLGDPDSALGVATPEWTKVIRDKRILINEVLADPSDDTQLGDANGDGVRNALQDEFVELVCVAPKAVDMTGWKLGDDDALDFQFPDGYILQPNEFVVIFGGGDVSSFPGYNADPLLTKVFVADGSIGDGLDEAGDYVVLQSLNGLDNTYLAFGSATGEPSGAAVTGITWEFPQSTVANAANDNSITRSPDACQEVNDPFVEHLTVASGYFSPGKTSEGFSTLAYTLTINVTPAGAGTVVLDSVSATKTEFGYGDKVTLSANANGLYIFDKWSGDESSIANPVIVSMKSSKVINAEFINAFQQPISILINEINADPSDDPILGDANGDGIRHPVQDEFVELVNIGPETVDLSGWMVGDDERISFKFPDGVTIDPGEFVTVFGGGNISGVPGYNVNPVKSRVFVSDIPDTLGNQLANAGETVIVISADSSYAMYCNYGSRYQQGPPVKDFNANFYYNMRMDAATLGDKNQSMTRLPDGNIDVLDNFVLHTEANENLESSANTTVDGQLTIQVNAIENDNSELPRTFKLYSNFPNPFNPTTTIKFATPKKTTIHLAIYNMLGQKVTELVNKECDAGMYEVQWNGKNALGESVPTGIYFYSINADGFRQTHKMILMK